jgi:hypothetical protein
VLDTGGEIFGEVPNIAARAQALAEPGSVVTTARVRRQVAGLSVAEERGSYELKGVPEPVTLYRIVRASGGGRRSRQRHLTPLVGREEELGNMAQGAWPIATEKVKHDPDYQEPGILHGPAKGLGLELNARIQRMAKRIYRILELDGYARIDFRLSTDSITYFLEANPNPEIAESQEFASAARHDGLTYPDLLHRILALGI